MNLKTKFILFTFVAIELLTISYSLNRGFDITDEGYYMLTYQDNYLGSSELIKSHEILRILTFGNPPDIIEARLLRLGLTLFAGIIFGLCFFVLMKRLNSDITRKYDILSFILISLTGILGSYSLLPRAISYNSLTLIFSVIITALLFLFMVLTLDKRSWVIKGGVILLTGVLLGTLFFIKFTSAIALFITACIFIVLLLNSSIKSTLLYLFLILASAIVTLTVYGLANEALKKFASSIFQIAAEIVNSQDQMNTRGILYQGSIIGSALLKLLASILIGAGLCMVYLRLKEYINRIKARSKIPGRVLDLLVLSGSLIFFFSIFYVVVVDFNNISIQIYIITITFFLTWSGELSGYKEFAGKNRISVLILLILAPLSISFGTDVPYMTHLLISLILIFAIPLLFFDGGHVRVFNGLFITLSVLVTIFVFNNNFLNPYRMARIDKYNVTIERNPVVTEKIKFQQKEADELLTIADLLVEHGYKRGDNIIGAYRIPGLVYLLGGTQPGGMLWGEQTEGIFLRNLRKVPTETLKETIIITRKPLNEAFIKVLYDNGINFPQDYKVYGKFSFGERELNTLTLYIPGEIN